VIETLERLGVAVFLAADLGAPMRAGVEQSRNRAVGAAREQQAAAADLTGEEIAGLRQFRLVAEIEPAFVEDLAPLAVQNRGVDECLT